MTQELINNSTIPTSINMDPHVNYKEMVKEGIKYIEEAGHHNWTNYNTSDPGRTILDMMCFALLDLGYKSEFPIQDILADKGNKIKIKNHLYEARDVLFSNPVTINDFRKILIDQAEGIKNAWVEPLTMRGGIKGAMRTFFEVSDILKIAYLRHLPPKRKKILNKELGQIRNGVNAILCQHRNLGDLFLEAVMLKPVSYENEGFLHLREDAEAEKALAGMLFTLNNLCSQYIQFKTYQEMQEEGLAVSEIMSGPKLDNGFIRDEDLLPLIKKIDTEMFRSKLLEDKNIESVYSFNIYTEGKSSASFTVPYGTIPFFDYSQISTRIYQENKFTLYQGNRQIVRLDQAKINAYYEELSGRKPVGNYNFKNQLGPRIPDGQFRDISTYHSIQNLFPQQFGLDVDRSYDGVPRSKRGPSKQLKGFLMLLEQIIADHQSQLAHLPKLLSFDSGVKIGKELCKTHYSQGLYNTPGSRFILKAYDNYIKINKYRDKHPNVSWDEFKKDKNNTYENFLNDHRMQVDQNIKQKSDVLTHLLARHGEKYNGRPPLELNPSYGDYSLAKAEIASSLLKNFRIYSGNMGRSYFAATEKDLRKSRLFCGLETRLGLTYQLNDYYRGIEDLVFHSLEHHNPHLKMDVGEEGKRIKMWYHHELLLDIPFIHENSHKTIRYFLKMMNALREQTQGLILIDNQLILSNLQNEKWSILCSEKLKKFRGKSGKILDAFPLHLAHRILEKSTLKEQACELTLQLRKEGRVDESKKTDNPFSSHQAFQGSVSIFLPDWVSPLTKSSFLKMFYKQIKNEGPAHLTYEVYHLSAAQMHDLLTLRKPWIQGIKNLQQGNPFGIEASIANELLLEFILDLKHKKE